MEKSLKNLIIKYINKEELDLKYKVQLLDDLYWTDWDQLKNDPDIQIDKLFDYLQSENLSIEEISKVVNLYNNLDGAYTFEFAEIIANLYKKDTIKFFQGLNLNPDETINLVYVFRMVDVFDDGDIELQKIKEMNKLTKEEISTANTFFNMYETICNT